MGVAAGEEEAVFDKVLQGGHVGELDARTGFRVVELGGVDAPVINDEKEDVVGAGDGVVVGRGDRVVDDGGVFAYVEGGVIEGDFEKSVDGIVGGDGAVDSSDSDSGDLGGEGRGGGEVEEVDDSGIEGEVLDAVLIEGRKAVEFGAVEFFGVSGGVVREGQFFLNGPGIVGLARPGADCERGRRVDGVLASFDGGPDEGDFIGIGFGNGVNDGGFFRASFKVDDCFGGDGVWGGS